MYVYTNNGNKWTLTFPETISTFKWWVATTWQTPNMSSLFHFCPANVYPPFPAREDVGTMNKIFCPKPRNIKPVYFPLEERTFWTDHNVSWGGVGGLGAKRVCLWNHVHGLSSCIVSGLCSRIRAVDMIYLVVRSHSGVQLCGRLFLSLQRMKGPLGFLFVSVRSEFYSFLGPVPFFYVLVSLPYTSNHSSTRLSCNVSFYFNFHKGCLFSTQMVGVLCNSIFKSPFHSVSVLGTLSASQMSVSSHALADDLWP